MPTRQLPHRVCQKNTYIDTFIIGVLELPDSFFVVGDHPILAGTILHTSKNEFRDLTSATSSLIWSVSETHLETRLSEIDVFHFGGHLATKMMVGLWSPAHSAHISALGTGGSGPVST